MYNSELYISECISSILNQGLPEKEYEILVINDGSTDNSCGVVSSFLEKNKNIKLLSQPNSGQSVARNTGIDFATGEYLFFVDSDDILFPNSLKSIYNLIADKNDFTYNSQDRFSTCDIITFGIQGGSISKYKELISKSSSEFQTSSIQTGSEYIANNNYNNSPCYYFIRKDFMSGIGLRFIEGKLCEDGMFTLTAFINAKSIVKIEKDVYFYVTRENSTTTTINPERIKKIISGFVFAIDYLDNIIEENRGRVSESCLQRMLARRDSYTFFLIIRLAKQRAVNDLDSLLSDLRSKKLYPIRDFIGKDYNGIRLKALCWLFNHKLLFLSLLQIKEKYMKVIGK